MQSPAHDSIAIETPELEWSVVYTADALANVRGGLREGSAWIDTLELAGTFDAGRALGIGDLTLFASVVRSNPPTFSDRYVGDAMIVSNIDSEQALRVLEAWVDWGFDAGGPGSVRVGLYDVNSEFDATASRGLFINSAYGMGQEFAQTGRNGPSVYPETALAARAAWAPAEPWLLEFAVVDGVPGDPGDTHRSRWHLSRSEGALLIGEISAAAGAIAQLSLGHWRYTATFEGLHLENPDGRGQFASDNHGTYVTAEFAPRTAANDVGRGWSGFLRAGTANDRVNAFEQHVAAGVVVAGPWPGRRGSQLGLAASEARVGDDYRAARRRDGAPAERYERNVELAWRVPVSEHAVLQPDLQYVVNPGAERRIPDAWVVGLRLEVSLAR
ncbi:MAG: carbohydrate porin [Steroidobacteraceae bacterium]|nr:carbohydrate porin [Steroidobacteraceae bacterium]